MSTTERWRGCLWLVLLCSAAVQAQPDLRAAGAAAAAEEGPFTQAQCLRCHRERDTALVAQWRDGPHGETADCLSCHGERHGALPSTRHDTACTGCHDGAVAHSYATSKHGVLVRIEAKSWDEPLERGRHRAPGCTYCHLHDRDHGDTMDPARGPSVREWICSGCHALRYVARQLGAGDRLVEVAGLKVDEARSVTARHPQGADAVRELLERVDRHLRNVRLGAGHQSPDYQWWHGQPALDGDLIQLRDRVASAWRGEAGRRDSDPERPVPRRPSLGLPGAVRGNEIKDGD